MRDLGTVRPGTTLYIPFATYDSNDPTASVTISGLATTDIEVYKDGSTTARTSDSGYALLGTDGVDEYGTGVHGISVNLADNTQAGFYAAGSQYWIVVASITVDAGTVNFIAATFRIGLTDAVLNTTIATLASQTSFTLTAGPAEDDALNGCVVYIHDVASAVQMGYGVVGDYTGSTKTVTLVAGATFTVAATDNISVFPPDVSYLRLGAPTGASVSADILAIAGRLPAALTGAGNMKADALALDGSTAAATNLKQSATVIYVGSVTGAATTTTLVDSGLTQADTDHWKGRIIIFLTGSLKYQATDITAFTPGTDTLTFTALTNAPAGADTYVVL